MLAKALGFFRSPWAPRGLKIWWVKKKKHIRKKWPLKHCFGTVCQCSLLVEFFKNRLSHVSPCILFKQWLNGLKNSSSWTCFLKKPTRPTSVTRSKIFRSFTSIRRGSVKSRRQDHVAKSPPALPDSWQLRFAPHGKLRFRTETLDKVISAPKMSKAFQLKKCNREQWQWFYPCPCHNHKENSNVDFKNFFFVLFNFVAVMLLWNDNLKTGESLLPAIHF